MAAKITTIMAEMAGKNNLVRVGLALGGLFLGALEYFLSRPKESTHLTKLISKLIGSWDLNLQIYGKLGNTLPEFVHPFAFALLTMSLLPGAGRMVRGFICIFWLVIDLSFEIGQHFGQQLSELIGTFIPHGRISGLLSDYFVNGTYDRMDIAAICSGIMFAFTISELTTRGGTKNDSENKKQKTIRRLQKANPDRVVEAGC
ncbi:MAG: hypothetical protein H8E17_10995 [Deltaproteobacteria bacterium]|nr:hypothetical protein [Deltaproteobacteria bacterium]